MGESPLRVDFEANLEKQAAAQVSRRVDAQHPPFPGGDSRRRLLPEDVEQRRDHDQAQHSQGQPPVERVVSAPSQLEIERAIKR